MCSFIKIHWVVSEILAFKMTSNFWGTPCISLYSHLYKLVKYLFSDALNKVIQPQNIWIWIFLKMFSLFVLIELFLFSSWRKKAGNAKQGWSYNETYWHVLSDGHPADTKGLATIFSPPLQSISIITIRNIQWIYLPIN